MEHKDKVQNSTGAQNIPVVGFGRRLAAALIDGLIILFFTFGISLLIIFVLGYLNIFAADGRLPVESVLIICGLILSFVYYVGFWSKSGQTFAKSVLGITVVGSDGRPLSFGKAVLRYIGYLISAIPLSLGFLWIAFDKERQGWHDKIASSYAIDGDADVFYDQDIEFVPVDSKPGWIWLLIWLLLAMVAPTALFGSLFILGPTVSRFIAGMIGN